MKILCSDASVPLESLCRDCNNDDVTSTAIRKAALLAPISWRDELFRERRIVVRFLLAVANVSLAATAAAIIEHQTGLREPALILLLGVLATAVLAGLGPSLAAVVLSVLAYDFFFTVPVHTFTIHDPKDVVSVVVFLIVAVLTSHLMTLVRDLASEASARETRTAALYRFTREAAAAVRPGELLAIVARHFGERFEADAIVMLAEGGKLTPCAAWPPGATVPPAEIEGASFAWAEGRSGTAAMRTAAGSRWAHLSLGTIRGEVAVVSLGLHRIVDLSPEDERLMDAFAQQAGVAIERVRLVDVLDKARVAAETERLRSALLTSLSHDLKTPLASIIGAATSLQQQADRYNAATRRDLVSMIQDEAERLSRFVHNLLDMTRLESGAIELASEPVDLSETVGAALARTAGFLGRHRVEVDLAADLPMLRLDVVLFEQVLFNLLDNAAKYSPPGSTIGIDARRTNGEIVLQVSDEGPGVAEDELDSIFGKFYRASSGDRHPAGTGLGLSVCRGFVTALGGTIRAANRTDRSGAVFAIALPASLAVETTREQASA
jgi:two-component system sensor histidine kinase KdpD